MTQKIVFYYGPKSGFRRHLPKRLPITTISELAIYSDRKMREHTFKIQSARRGAENPEKEAERLQVPCLVAFSEQYASISESAINSFLSFIGQFDVGSKYLQNPPMHVVSQFESLHSRIKTIRYDYRTLDFDCLRRINREYDGVIIGQPEVKEKLLKALYPLASGSSEKPAVLLFYGPTGVGKTYLAKMLAEQMFGKQEALIQIDMSEYMEKHTVSRLIGSPPGYVGYDEAGQLTEKIRRKPYSVVLFDEIEKAHPDVMNILLQILDDGHITDAQGRNINFENTVIIMTTNAGSNTKNGSLGFVGTAADKDRERAMKALGDFLRPEFINRVDEIICFNKLTEDNFRDIAGLMLGEVRDLMREKGMELTWDESVIDYLVKKSYSLTYGARNLRRTIQKDIEDAMASVIVDGRRGNVKAIHLTSDGEKVNVEAE